MHYHSVHACTANNLEESKRVAKSKSSRKERRRNELAQKKRKRTLLIGGSIAAVALIAIVLIIVRGFGGSVEGAEDKGPQLRGHDEGVVIESGSLPPVGGTHSPRWQNCGIYDQPVEAKNAIHSMEHGAVWLTHRPDLPDEDVEALHDLVRGRSYVLLSPYPDLASDVVLSAWGVQLQVDSVEDERIAQFINQYRLGPQTPEFGAPCDGGIGRPIG
ncbi:MAG: DUF3105 domain-containing protein [Chloroflexota bacterium]|nr:MAG: DUF3105 domain-containing protein [Chloroflexota bacterium]